MENMTPLEIKILLHYWSLPGDYRLLDSKMVKKVVGKFLKHGILEMEESQEPRKYKANIEALEPYIKAICSIPLPEKKWVINSKESGHVWEPVLPDCLEKILGKTKLELK